MVEGIPTASDQLAEASALLRQDPSRADMWHRVGYLLLERGRWTEALPYLTQALTLQPDHLPYIHHCALAELERGALEAAAERLAPCLSRRPIDSETWLFTAELLCRAAHYGTAHVCFARAAETPPARKSSLMGMAYTSFITGHLQDSLPLLAASDAVTDDLPLPLWDGDRSRTIMLVGEYGYGDLIHYLRYVDEMRDMLRAAGGDVILSLPHALVELVAQNKPDFTIYDRTPPARPDAALTFKNVVTTVPERATAKLFYLQAIPHLGGFHTASARVPYLKADTRGRDDLLHLLVGIPHPRIGLIWSGNPRHRNDHNRSVPPRQLEPIIDAARPHLVSLQHGGSASALGIADAAPLIHNFADTATLMAHLDLVITIDSAPAHLAGALGVPTWVMLPFDHDWRWLMGREDCIWYPTVRLYRQTAPQDWPSVTARIAADLMRLMGGDSNIFKIAPQPVTPNLTQHPHAINTPALQSLLNQLAEALKVAS